MKLQLRFAATAKTIGNIELDGSATIHELRLRVGRLLIETGFFNVPREEILCHMGKIILSDEMGNNCKIFADDSGEPSINEAFLMQHPHFPTDFILGDITAYFWTSLDPYSHKPTTNNPQGAALYAFGPNEKRHAFFTSINQPNAAMNFIARLERIGFHGVIPDKFLDPITVQLMNTPIIASDGYTYDEKTIKQLNWISPFTRTKLKVLAHNLLLCSQIEKFISLQESENTQETQPLNLT